ncbi:ASKHA domain-containing protein [Marinifilum sp. RC60d5]|uniref:ASKHA domain-containing protein n=1 Tax=Marinifilum sp. RC60d5 TaxID=3458414 RepID=UPI0040353391
MSIIFIHQQGKVYKINYKTGESLLKILQDKDIVIAAPCGGKGTCGKCKLNVDGEGEVLACCYYPNTDIHVHLPDTQEAHILSSNLAKHEFKIEKQATYAFKEYGLAIDIGTTSVVFYWVNYLSGKIDRIQGIENPQVQFGADVITRINYCSKEESLLKLQMLIVGAINNEISEYLKEQPAVILKKISVAANTCMLHLLNGVNPMPMALAPFIPPFIHSKELVSSTLGIRTKNDVMIHLLPSASAFVGADIVAGISSLNPPENSKNYLFLDIGTNGEMAVVTPNKIYACATAAGPAFEGATIECGMGAFEGAISVYNKKGYQTIGNKLPIGICGSGLIDIMAYLLEEGHVGTDGNLNEDFILASTAESGSKHPVCITPRDIREVQLAKSAIFTGVKLLLQEANLSYEQLDSVYLAGGFGNYMNPDSALRIGLIPGSEKVPIVPVGNTSGAGAVLHVSNSKFTDKLEDTLAKMKIIDLSAHPDFELEFAMNMYF